MDTNFAATADILATWRLELEAELAATQGHADTAARGHLAADCECATLRCAVPGLLEITSDARPGEIPVRLVQRMQDHDAKVLTASQSVDRHHNAAFHSGRAAQHIQDALNYLARMETVAAAAVLVEQEAAAKLAEEEASVAASAAETAHAAAATTPPPATPPAIVPGVAPK